MKRSCIMLAARCCLRRAALAALNIFACEPEWGALAKELGGDKASVYVATTALQDPHRIEARPSLIARARSADLVVCTGAELEIGWLPLRADAVGQSRRSRPASRATSRRRACVTLIEMPRARRPLAWATCTPAGNPHIHLDPRNIAKVAAALGERMAQLDPRRGRALPRARARRSSSAGSEATARWEKAGRAAEGHAARRLPQGPFLPRSAGSACARSARSSPSRACRRRTAHLSELLARLQADAGQGGRALGLQRSARRPSGSPSAPKIPAVMLPFTVGGTDKAKDLFGLYDDTLARLLAAAK